MTEPDHPGIVETAHYNADDRSLIARIEASAGPDQPPKRPVRLVLDLGADDRETVCRALVEIADDLERSWMNAQTHGAPDVGWHFEVAERPITPETFHEQLTAWRDARHQSRTPTHRGDTADG